jgi:Helix-turn-helix domain
MRLRRPVMSEEEAQAAMTVLRAVADQRILVEHDADKVRGAIEAIDTTPVFDGDKVERDPSSKQMGKFARGSETSRKAALANYPRAGSQRARILEHVLASGGAGRTREELEDRLGLTGNTVRPRVRELIDGGWLRVRKDGGTPVTRRTTLGNASEVLEATERAAKHARRAREAVPA